MFGRQRPEQLTRAHVPQVDIRRHPGRGQRLAIRRQRERAARFGEALQHFARAPGLQRDAK